MPRRTPLLGVLAMCAAGSCMGPRRSPAPADHARAPTLEAEPPRADPGGGLPVPHALPPVEHPNATRDGDTLGARMSPRPLPLPHVGLGQSATFHFAGRRRGWVARLSEGETLLTPAYDAGRVYVGAGFSSTTVFALDAHTGALRWTAATPDGGPSAAIVDDETVLFNTESCTLFAFDARTGRQRWSKYLGDPLMSQPVAARGRVFTAWPDAERPGGFAFGALSLRDGHIVWSRAVSADVMTAPVVVGDDVYATLMDGTVARWRTADGHRVWSRAAHATSAPAVDGASLFLAQRVDGGHERPLSLRTDTGAVIFRGEAVRVNDVAQRPDTGGTQPGWAWEGSRPAVADGRVYQAMGDEVVARDERSGAVVWRKRNPMPGGARGVTAPAVVGGQLVVGTRSGDVFGLDIDSGQTTWAVRVGEPIAQQPAVADGWVYVATTRGKVVGVEVGEPELDGWHMWGGNASHTGATPPQSQARAADRPEAGELRTTGVGGERLPMVHTAMEVTVDGPVARVEVTQDFVNPHDRSIDAEYLFPLPGDAAVNAMQLRVGDRVVEGTVQTRDGARRTFQNARARGRTAALLEEERPDLFQQSVANIHPGERVRVRMRFVETVAWREGRYELVLPLRAGGVPGQAPGDATVRATVSAGVPLASVTSPSHDVHVAARGDVRDVSLAGPVPTDRDFVLRWVPVADIVAPAVLTSEGPDGRYLTLVLHPGANPPDAAVTPREMVFALDVSSSMRGRPLAQAQAVVRASLRALRPTDTFRLVAFSDVATHFDPNAVAADAASLARAVAWVDALQAAGSTGLRRGLDAALSSAVAPRRVRIVTVLSDGYAGDDRAVLAGVRGALGGARIFTVGVGTTVNRWLLGTLADDGRGELHTLAPSDDPEVFASTFARALDRPCLTDVSVDFGDLDVHDALPRELPDLFAGRPVVLHARYVRGGHGIVRVRGLVAGRPWQRDLVVDLPSGGNAPAHATGWNRDALPSLWARARVAELERAMLLGETDALRAELTSVGLRFGLVTETTSFVAVDEGVDRGARESHLGTRGRDVGGVLGAVGYGAGMSTMGDVIGTAFGYGGSGAVGAPSVHVAAMPAIRAMPAPVPEPSASVHHADEEGGRARIAHPSATAADDGLAPLRARLERFAEERRRQDPSLRGAVRVEVLCDASGRIVRVRVLGDGTLPDQLTAGLTEALHTLVLGPGMAGRSAVVPLALEPGAP